MINGFVSFKTILNKLYRDLKITNDISESDVAEWCAEVLERIGAYAQYEPIKTCLELTDGKAKLPLNFHKLVDISFAGVRLSWSNQSFYNEYACDGCSIPFCCTTYNFYINNSYIITDIPTTEVNTDGNNNLCIIYLGVVTDDEGYPMIPDDTYFKEACVRYVTYMLDYQKWRRGELPDKVKEDSETNYLWYVGASKGSANMPNAAKMDQIMNVWVRLIPSMDRDKVNLPERRRLF